MQTKSMTQIGVLCFLLITIVLSSNCASINKEYVAADRNTYEAISPRYLNYIEKDKELRDWEKKLQTELTASWLERIEEAEK